MIDACDFNMKKYLLIIIAMAMPQAMLAGNPFRYDSPDFAKNFADHMTSANTANGAKIDNSILRFSQEFGTMRGRESTAARETNSVLRRQLIKPKPGIAAGAQVGKLNALGKFGKAVLPAAILGLGMEYGVFPIIRERAAIKTNESVAGDMEAEARYLEGSLAWMRDCRDRYNSICIISGVNYTNGNDLQLAIQKTSSDLSEIYNAIREIRRPYVSPPQPGIRFVPANPNPNF